MANGHGGARPNSGRPRALGVLRANARAAELLAQGITPLEVMLILMRDSWTEYNALLESEEVNFQRLIALRDQTFAYAQAAAPYAHPRLAQIKNEDTNNSKTYTLTVQPEDAQL